MLAYTRGDVNCTPRRCEVYPYAIWHVPRGDVRCTPRRFGFLERWVKPDPNKCTTEEFSFIIATNVESTFHLSQLAHPLLKASSSGNIVLMSSVSRVVNLGNTSIYGATKGAMNQLARNLACEWAIDNIRANSLCPWFITTPSFWVRPARHPPAVLSVSTHSPAVGHSGVWGSDVGAAIETGDFLVGGIPGGIGVAVSPPVEDALSSRMPVLVP
uniref:Putative-tropinone-reductase22 n=1 Tax=Arabidopsis cebennensis TaxID=97979 RepID=B2BXZ6_9BRAS|nr:putative-tropinone-reductase22 [Arabidopsis cebennensis]